MPPAFEVLLLNTAVPQIQAAQSGDTYVVPRDIAFSAALTLSAGTANGVPYLNGSKVLTSGSALTFDGTGLSVGTTAHPYKFMVSDGGATGFEVGPGTTYVAGRVLLQSYNRSSSAYTAFDYSASEHKFQISGSDSMTLTSTGLGIGTSSPGYKLGISGVATTYAASASIALYDTISGVPASRNWLIGNVAAGNYGELNFAVSSAAGGAPTNSKMTLDSSGNLGLGATPSDWGSTEKAFTILGSGSPIQGSIAKTTNTNGVSVVHNAYYNAGWKYIYAGGYEATRYELDSGAHKWFTAPSGTAGNPISFNQRMTLTEAGNLGIGETNPGSRLHVSGVNFNALFKSSAAGFSKIVVEDSTGVYKTVLLSDASGGAEYCAVGSESNHPFVLRTNNTERARITSGGDFQTSSGNSVMVGGTAARATTAGTNRVDIFDGTAPVGTLANGISLYSSSGEAYVMDAAGNATLFSPHDAATNEWIFRSKHTPTGKVLKIDVERLLKFVNDHFGLDAVHEFIED